MIEGEWVEGPVLDIEDSNEMQSFPVSTPPIIALRIIMTNPSDFYGRIIVYHLRLYGIDG